MLKREIASMLSVVKIILFFVILWHWSSCVWFFVNTRIENPEETFTWYNYNELDEESVLVKYLYSIYFTMNIVTSVGYGDMFATTDLERVMTMLVILTGDALFAVGFGMLASIAMQSSQFLSLSSYMEQIGNADKYMENFNFH